MTKVKSCLLCENYKTHPCECVHCEDWDNFRTSEDGKNLVKRIENEVRPKGEWIKVKPFLYKCSFCGRTLKDVFDDDLLNDYPFCHCGAWMGDNE